MSTWDATYLDVPTPRRVFVMPITAALMTAGLGVFVMWRAQRREHSYAKS